MAEIVFTDCNFVAVLYTSESDKIMRYTDEARILTRREY